MSMMLTFGKKKKGNLDFFEHIGSKMKSKNGKRTVSNSTIKYQTAYGSWIADCKSPKASYKWSIKINKLGSGAQICIGIQSANKLNNLESAFHAKKTTHYAYKNNGDIFYNTDIAQEMPARYKENDLVIMVLKTNEKTIEFYRNDTIVQRCCDINKEKYRLAVSLWGNKKNATVTITDCKIKPYQQHKIEQKDNNMVDELLNTIETQKKEILQLKQEVNILKDEKKEYQVTMDDLKKQIKNLKGNLYLKWNSNDLLDWILSIEGGLFKQYQEILTKEILNNSVTGKDLKTININDIKRFGVKKFSHQQLLMKLIVNLVPNNHNNVVPVVSDEEEENDEGGVTYC